MDITISYDALCEWLERRLSEMLDVPLARIDPDATFADHGMSSVMAVELSADLEDLLGRSVVPTVAYEYPTIRSLAAFLSGEGE